METNTKSITAAKVQTQLALCAAAAAGVAAVAPNAEATIVTTYSNRVITIPNTNAGIYLNLETGASGTAGSAVAGYDFNPYLTGSMAAFPNTLGFYWGAAATRGAGVATGATTDLYADLAPGTLISSASPFTSAIAGTTASYQGTGTHILGFRFITAAGTTDYGYLTIQTTAAVGFPATIRGWTYENTGASITTVPEPSTVAMLALTGGAIGVRAWRRRRVAA